MENGIVLAQLYMHPLSKKINFTESTGVGKMITGKASKTMKMVSMELGANALYIAHLYLFFVVSYFCCKLI